MTPTGRPSRLDEMSAVVKSGRGWKTTAPQAPARKNGNMPTQPPPIPSGSIPMGGRSWIESREDAWYHLTWRDTEDGWEARSDGAIIALPFEPLKIVRTEVEERLVVKTHEEIAGPFEDVLKQLDRRGCFLSPSKAKKCLAFIQHHLRRSGNMEMGRETFEAYAKAGDIALPDSCYPKPGAQADDYLRLKEVIEYEPTADDWQKYVEYESKLAPKETYPAKASAAIGPFARLLRGQGFLVPGIYHTSTNSGSGKTTTVRAYSEKAWNVKMESCDGFSSDFRLAHHLASIGTPFAVDEAEKFDWSRFGGTLKTAMESESVTSRGTKEQGLINYPSRRIVMMTGNGVGALPKAELVRFFIVRYNEERHKLDRESVKRFDATFDRLMPVGPALAQAALVRWKTIDVMKEEIRRHADALSAATTFKDLRRAKSWAVHYAFLHIWEDASNGIHKTPPLADFIRDVVGPVEKDTFSAQMDRLEMFQAWFDAWRVRNSYQARDGNGTKGDGQTWKDHTHETTKKTRHAGFLVTKAILDEYNRDAWGTPSARIDSHAELARLVAERYPIPKDDLTDNDGKPALYDFNSSRRRAVFIPNDTPEVFREVMDSAPNPVQGFGGQK